MNAKMRWATAVLAAAAAATVLAMPMTGATAKGGKPGGVTAGNNLSFPVEWSEAAYKLTLPGTMETASIAGTVATGTYTMEDLTPCLGAVQKQALNVWQAENAVVTPNAVTTIDWGDNLESKDWRAGQVVRVETGLYDEALPAAMTKYEMCYISGSGTTEVWGARVTDNGDGTYTPVTTESNVAMVYTAAARLTIQKVDPALALTWDPVTHVWTGPGVIGTPIFNKATYEKTADGPGSYGAELNVQGKVVYGYVWQTSGLTAGEYRLTFSLDQPTAFTPGVTLEGAQVLTTTEGSNQAVVQDADDLTYIDVGLTGKAGGGGKK